MEEWKDRQELGETDTRVGRVRRDCYYSWEELLRVREDRSMSWEELEGIITRVGMDSYKSWGGLIQELARTV